MCTHETRLPITFVTKEESNKREQWFDNFKYPVLNIITLLQEGVQENTKLDFEDITSAIDFFNRLIAGLEKDTDGVRMYFASPSGSGKVEAGKCGILTLIFCATKGAEKSDVKIYYTLDRKKVITIPENEARDWVHNYQNVKRNILFETLSDFDRLNNCKETKHVWFSLRQMKETIHEMECQSERSSKISGFGIRFVSYTNQDYYFPEPKEEEFKKRQRLTLAFTFMDTLKLDIGIEDINKEEFDQRYEATIHEIYGDTFDTGDPTPPPPTGNKADLDVLDE
ncbi:hypothetical protein [Pedobacter sp. UBA5917]|jgi:hypothetical protein|uniref:hypothetical protein n=1 Tax=Pedobacter sp. UBA5917 TaxID=1947061 RepID=UPI0025FA36D4|nr:hypothetical protein [Pedobacter sp. UBA5917]